MNATIVTLTGVREFDEENSAIIRGLRDMAQKLEAYWRKAVPAPDVSESVSAIQFEVLANLVENSPLSGPALREKVFGERVLADSQKSTNLYLVLGRMVKSGLITVDDSHEIRGNRRVKVSEYRIAKRGKTVFLSAVDTKVGEVAAGIAAMCNGAAATN